MFYSYLKLALRQLWKRRVFTFINLLGLISGMVAFLVITRYVAFESSYDGFHQDFERLYRLEAASVKENGAAKEWITFPPTLANLLTQELSEIQETTSFSGIDYQNNTVIYEEGEILKAIEQEGIYFADSSFDNLFSFPMLAGGFSEFGHPWKAVITQEMAAKFFGEQSAMGKTLTISGNLGEREYEVVGIIRRPPNTHFDFSMLVSMPSRPLIEGDQSLDCWDCPNFRLYFESGKPISSEVMAQKINQQLADHPRLAELYGSISFDAVPVADIYLKREAEGSRWQTVRLLSLIALLILLIAWINYINLTTAQAVERAREVGIKKVLGSGKGQLIRQFLFEAFALNLLSVLFAWLVTAILLPPLRQITEHALVMPEGQFPVLIAISAAAVLLGTLFSGAYPAFVLSAYPAITTMKGNLKTRSSGLLLRKLLVVMQFSASLVLLVFALTVYRQLDYMRQYELGIDIEDMVILDSPPGSLVGDNQGFFRKVADFKEAIRQYPRVKAMTTSSAIPGKDINWQSSSMRLEGKEADRGTMYYIAADEDYPSTFGLDLLAGRYYKPEEDPWSNNVIVFSKTAASKLGFENPADLVGEYVECGMFQDKPLEVIGVMEDYHHQSLKNPLLPIVLVNSIWSNYYTVKFDLAGIPVAQRADVLRESLGLLEKEWEQFFPDAPFNYFFMDSYFNSQYKSEERFRTIFNIFTFLALFIACIGLIGLSSYTTLQKTKEIGIRKILGASSGGILLLLSKDYLRLLLISILVSVPVSNYFLVDWLEDFAYQIDIQWWMFALPSTAVALTALISISSQSLRAALSNPVNSLRSE